MGRAAAPDRSEWEYASRGGLVGARFPWGNESMADDGSYQCNIWQGTFPTVNSLDDGYLTTAPVRSYRPNGYGLWQTVGNVWEWCADFFSPRTYHDALAAAEPARDPQGPAEGDLRVLRGEFLPVPRLLLNRYRNAARSSNTPDSSMGNTGFRTVGRPGDRPGCPVGRHRGQRPTPQVGMTRQEGRNRG